MALEIEAYHPQYGWISVGKIAPGNIPGSMSDNNPDGRRDVYMFECLGDDSKSTIYRSRKGFDIADAVVRTIVPLDEMDVVAELGKGSRPYEMEIRTDNSHASRKIRFTHR